MQVGKYLEANQPIIYKTFINSLKEDKLSHAYLLVGDPGTPLKEVATYLHFTIPYIRILSAFWTCYASQPAPLPTDPGILRSR